MQKKKYKLSAVDSTDISKLGFGCSSFWAKPIFSASKAISLVHQAHEAGINHYDTGPNYADGEAERRLGKALDAMNRDSLIISTKIGADVTEKKKKTNYSTADLKISLDSSLKRLKLDYVDILYLWGADLDDLNDEVMGLLENLKDDGKIRMTAVNSFRQPVLEKCLTLPIDGVMLQYNVVDQSSRSLVDDFANAGKFIISATAVGQALYTKSTFLRPKLSSAWYALRALKKNIHVIKKPNRLAFLHDHDTHSAVQLALAYLLKQDNISSCVFGTTREEHLLENIAALEINLESDVIEKIHNSYSP